MEEAKPIDRKARVTEMRKTMIFRKSTSLREHGRHTEGHRRATEAHDFPNADKAPQLANFIMRNTEDESLRIQPKKLPHDDSADTMSRTPSYTNFKVDYSYICHLRYSKACRDYEAQFQREIASQIDYQPSAVEMLGLVRHMAYTSLWPPLHDERELEYTHTKMFQLTKKEKKRYEQIMSTNF